MHRAAGFALAALCTALPLRGAAQIEIPTAADGYTVTQTSSSVDAPAGYMGRTDKATQSVVGREPNVVGRQYINRFTMANEIRICPLADGTAEGDGEFTVSTDYTRAQAGKTNSWQMAMSAKAQYKGKVGEDGFLYGPVTADIDFTYAVKGGVGARIDPTNPAPIFEAQHITIKFDVAKKMFDAPTITAFAGGDPTQGHLETANKVGLALTYWGGVFYSFAETQWMTPNKCVQVAFDPPSNSRQPVPGSTVKVNAFIQTKGGEGVRGKFPEVNPHNPNSESVTITSSAADPASPAIFTYTAPNKTIKNAGFRVSATSRGGAAQADWDTGIGTNWSGEITVSKVSPGDDRNSDLQTAYHHEAARITINVKDGVGTADGFSEVHGFQENRQYVASNGTKHLEFSDGGTDEATVEGQAKATAGVMFDEATGHYTVTTTVAPFPVGTRHTTSCIRDKCTSRDDPYSVPAILTLVGGKVVDPNHVSGSMNLGAPLMPGFSAAKGSYVVTWDLSRQGTTK